METPEVKLSNDRLPGIVVPILVDRESFVKKKAREREAIRENPCFPRLIFCRETGELISTAFRIRAPIDTSTGELSLFLLSFLINRIYFYVITNTINDIIN